MRSHFPICETTMATILSKPVRRRVEVRERGRALPQLYTVELTQDGVRMRSYGTRTWLGPVPFGLLLLHCGRATAQQRAIAKARTRRPA